jgi:L-malate glycosyltransferase
MASGVAIVSTDVGGIPHLVEDGRTALLVPPRDPMAMAAAALRVFAEPGLAASLRTAGLGAAERYTWGNVRPLLLSAYARALGRSSVRPCTT